MPRLSRVPVARYGLELAAVAGVYVAAGKFGIDLSVAHGVITPVWAPSGISLAALLLFGQRLWPAITLGSFVVNATSGAGALVALGIAPGNTLEAVVGAYLLRRFGFRNSLERVRDVLQLVLLGALGSTLIAATNGTTVLWLAGSLTRSYGSSWLLWWFGDAAGDLWVVPLLLGAAAWRWRRYPPLRLVEAAALVGALGGTGAAVFLLGGWRYPYVLFPFLLWAALRFRQDGAAIASFLVGALATWGTLRGDVPVSVTNPTERVQVIQALVGILAISLLVFAAVIAERERSREQLALTAARLGEAQALTHIGSWEWDIAADRILWSEELYRIYGLEPGVGPVAYSDYVERIHPDDRAVIEAAVSRSRETHEPFSFEHRIVLPRGGVRLVHGRGRVVVDESGKPVRMLGTSQDVTDHKQAESLREDILSTVSHELRTPLTSVLGFAVTLKERGAELDDETRELIVDQLGQQAHRLDRLLADLLDIERLRRGVLVAVREPTEVAALVRQLAAEHELDEQRLTLAVQPVVANVDAPKLERILDNLLANAVKHTPAGTRISLSVEAEGGDLLIAVDDEGPGVPDEFKAGLFDIFNRGSKVLSSDPGTGIGLALVARFAALHGGRAWVEDGTGGGASFRVLLPACVLS